MQQKKQQQQLYERYKQEETTTQGEGRHHWEHVFFILQRGIQTAIGIDTKLKTYMDYINGNEQQPNENKDNIPRTKTIGKRKDGQIWVLSCRSFAKS